MKASGLARAALVAAALGIAGTLTAFAPHPARAQMLNVELTPQIVEQVIASYPAVKAAADSVRSKYGVKDGGASGWGAWMNAQGAWGEMNGVVAQYGFASFPDWLGATMAVATAYAFAKEGGAVDSKMAEALAGIQNNPSIPEAQKKMLIEQMKASMGAVAAIQPSAGNRAAVAPYAGQLKALFD